MNLSLGARLAAYYFGLLLLAIMCADCAGLYRLGR